MKNLALPRIQEMDAYRPPLDGRRAFDGLLLDFNERTTDPEYDLISQAQIYPEYGHLEEKIADNVGVGAENVMITNGTDQGIDVLFRTFVDRDDTVIIPEPSFSMFSHTASVVGTTLLNPAYKKSDDGTAMLFPTEEVLDLLENDTSASIKLVVICNPNNPTGTLLSVEDIERIAQTGPEAIIFVDEAYAEFSGQTAVDVIDKYSNIIVTRTFSKAFGLAAVRIGYTLAHSQYIEEMLKVRGPYDINQVAAAAARTALEQVDSMRAYRDEVMNQAKPLVEEFFQKNNIAFYASEGNFILFESDDPHDLEEKLRAEKILVRPQNKTGIEGTIRVSIGTKAQMKEFISAFEKILNEKNHYRKDEGGKQNSVRKYAILDRDGTLIYEPPGTFQIDSAEKLEILPGVIKGLQKLQNEGFSLVMVTNQDGLGTDSFEREGFEQAQKLLLETFQDEGIIFEEIFICPHFETDHCSCRKPQTGILEKFLETNPLDSQNSFVCGDRDSDQGLAHNLGVKFISMESNGNFSTAIADIGEDYHTALNKLPKATERV